MSENCLNSGNSQVTETTIFQAYYHDRKDQRLGEILRIQAIGIRNGQDLNEIKI